MNRTDLIHAVARRCGEHPEDVAKVLDTAWEVLSMAFTLGEETSIRGFGRFIPRPPGPVGTQSYVRFRPSDRLRARMASGEVDAGPLVEPRGKRPRAPKLNHDELHRAFWAARDHRNRLVIRLEQVAQDGGVTYEVARQAVANMRNAGRLRDVGNHRNRRIYEVTDPERWQPGQPPAPRRRQPSWG